MAKRALVIGSQTGGLAGVHSDVEVVIDAVTRWGFSTTRAIEADATYDAIVERLRGLVEDTAEGDAALVYYSGHGGRRRNPRAASDAASPTWLQYLVPTDYEDRSGDRFRVVLAQELSRLQLELTQKTANVTTILDCCHSARMSRAATMLPKAYPAASGSRWDDLENRWAAIRAEAGHGAVDSNPLAVRIVACSPDQSAYELYETELGGPHGALTSRLVPILNSREARSLTWQQVVELTRPGILDVVPEQRPDVEGPATRFLFSTETADESWTRPVVVEGGVALLEGAAMFGIAEGDTYAVVEPGGDPRRPLATAVVDTIFDGRARLQLDGAPADAIPAGATAHPVEVALGARPVAVVPPDHPDRKDVVAALGRSPHVQVVERQAEVLATVSIGADGIRVLDAAGEPLHSSARRLTSGTLTLIVNDLQKLARATHVRELASGREGAALEDEVDIEYARLTPPGGEVALAPSGEHLFNGDRIVVRAHSRSSEARYVSVIDIGIAGAISIQTTSEPDGVTLAPGERYEVGRDVAGRLEGLELFWPPAVPANAPRAETFVTIVSDRKVDGLVRLQQEGVRSRSSGGEGPPSNLTRLIDDLNLGRRDSRSPESPVVPVRYRVHRFDFVLHPEPRGGEPDEPDFEIDDRPDPSFRLVVPRARGHQPPRRVAVRLKELVVHSNRAIFASAVRVDAMVVTVPPDALAPPYGARSEPFPRVKDGDRLPLDDLLVYEGPVGRFLDLAVWVSRVESGDVDLAELLVGEAGSHDVEGAVAVLAGLAVGAPQAAVVARSAAAVATLIRTAARVLGAAQGESIGVYRTSLLPHQRFGAGDDNTGIGRHPRSGLIRAQDMSFAFEVIDLDRT